MAWWPTIPDKRSLRRQPPSHQTGAEIPLCVVLAGRHLRLELSTTPAPWIEAMSMTTAAGT